MTVKNSKALPAFLFVIAFSSFLFFFNLGARSFRNPDEGRYAEIARQMAESGDWVEPRLYGVDYLRKPPLFYWLVAVSFKVFGFTEFAARLVPAAFGVLGVLATFLFARSVFGLRSAFLAALMLASNAWYLQVGRFLLIDTVFTFFLVSGLYLFYLALEGGKPARYFLFFYVCTALAFLSKGVVALVIPGLLIPVYLLVTNRFREGLSRMRLGWGLAIFSAMVLPWLVVISRREPEFLNIFFYHEHFKRFVSAQFEHQKGWYFYLWVVPVILLPWPLFFEPLKKALSPAADGAGKARSFLWIASATIILFYSLSRTKLPTYILPAIPPLMILLADGWSRWEVAKPGVNRLFFAVIFAMALGSVPVFFLMKAMNEDYTTRHFAQTLKSRIEPGDAVFIYDHPGAFYDFRFYLGHPVKLAGLEGELKLVENDEEVQSASVSHADFERMLAENQPVYCLMRKSDLLKFDPALRRRLRILREDRRKILFSSGGFAAS